MKKMLSVLFTASLLLSLCACGSAASGTSSAAGTKSPASSAASSASASSSSASSSPENTTNPEFDLTIEVEETTAPFSLASEDGTFDNNDGIYTITSAGTFVLSGRLDGQIVVDAGSSSEVILELKEATICCDTDSPVKVLSADKVEISAKQGTDNVIRDNRQSGAESDDEQGDGAIYAKSDLKLKGTGKLWVDSGYGSGIHTTKDLKIQKLSLKSSALSCAIRGDDSITMESGTVVAISTRGDGLKTDSTDANKSGATRGNISLLGGTMKVFAAGDGFQAAHDFEMAEGEDSGPSVTIYTGTYSAYTDQEADTTSFKGIKTQNELNISAGDLSIYSYDDGLHADRGETFDDGTAGTGTINISGGTISMGVYSTETATAGGQTGAENLSFRKMTEGAAAIHTDGTLNISGGQIDIDSAHEGLEANVINISGGRTTVMANDDCVNATKGDETPLINITGGYLETSVPANGDVDGMDSNGDYRQTGGIVITRGPGSEMAAAIDADGTAVISGGTLIVLGYGKISAGEGVSSYNISLHEAGTHTVTIGGTRYTFTNSGAYGSTACYSDVPVEIA